MQAPVLRIVPNVEEQLRPRLEAALKVRGVKLRDSTLSTFATWDINSRTVLFFGARTDQPVCLIHEASEGRLLGNEKLRALPVTITALRLLQKSIRPILDCGAFDLLEVSYCREPFAVLVDASLLLERLR